MRLGTATAIALVASACRTPAPADKHSLPPSADASPPAPTSAASSSTAPPVWLGEGCLEGVDPNGSDAELIERVARACAPGMKRRGDPALVTGDGGPLEVRFPLAGAACVRIVAVGSSRAEKLELELLDPRGSSLARERAAGPVALLGARGPVCLEKAGVLRVVARGAPSALVALLEAD